MTDDGFEKFLRSAIQDLDPVPEVPREEMWARIEAARRSRRHAWKKPPRRSWYLFGVWPAAAAALLAVGFGVGRFSDADRLDSPAVASTSQERPSDPVDPKVDDTREETPLNSARPLASGSRKSPPSETRATSDMPDDEASSGDMEAPYRLAALWHLSQAEGLLTSVAVGEVDQQLTRWAAEMLTTTRLMLDSPAADDPRMARLLEDLELILVQIASTTEDRKDAELRWIQQGLETNNVLPRLRAVLPADRQVIGT